MPNPDRIKVVFGTVFFLIALILPSFLVDRTDASFILISYAIAFVAYLTIWNSNSFQGLFVVGLLARIGLFFSLPVLSDDVFRFLWDGYLLKAGIHPFAELPSYYLEKGIPGLTQELFSSLNSERYFTVYPPINQGIFWLSVFISNDWLVSVGVIRIFLLASDLVAVYFIRKILKENGINQKMAFLYFLNPLVILEGVGNLHFEVMVCAFLAISLYSLYRKKAMSAAVGFGLAIGTKLLPLVYFPYFFFKEIKERKLRFTLISTVVAFVVLIPMLSPEFLIGFTRSLSLYFTNFEFNGSLFALAREASIWLTGYNEIKVLGPIFSIASILGILTLCIVGVMKKWKPEVVMLAVLTVYLAFATTVHPWYILPLILFGISSGYVYPIIWSLMIFVTYAGYSSDGYSLSGYWILLEYIVVVLSFIFNDRLKKWLTIS